MINLETERLISRQEYKLFSSQEISGLNKELKENTLWYMPNTPVGKLLDESPFWGDEAKKPGEWDKTWEVFRLIHDARIEGRLALGNKNQFKENFNDDDRWCPENWDHERNFGINRFTKELNPAVEKPHPDTVVIHHTNTPPGFSLDFFNTIAMLRLYVPLARSGFPGYGGKNYPLNSGHYDKEGKMLFHGYHYYVREDGKVEQVLKEDETGFHAGNYSVNIKATGIALDGDFTDKIPPDAQIEAVNNLLKSLNPANIIGHQEVELKGEKVAHNCPGEHTWDNWKKRLSK
jgi:hypothetical protein